MIQNWKTLVLLALAGAGTGCQVEAEHPPGPNGSWWVGGADGGVFVLVQDDANPNDDLYTGAIYFEHDQGLWYRGPLRLVGKPRIDPAERGQYQGWDGERLLLEDGAALEAVEPVPPL